MHDMICAAHVRAWFVSKYETTEALQAQRASQVPVEPSGEPKT